MDWTEMQRHDVEQTLIWFLEDASLRYFLDRPYMKRTAHAKSVILRVAQPLGQSPEDFRRFFKNLLLKFADRDPDPFRLIRANPLAIYQRITDKTTWLDFEALTFEYEEQPETEAHLHALDPNRQHDAELLHVGAYTLPKGIQCERCSYRMALVTDVVNAVPDRDSASIFRKQTGLLQEALTADHEEGHPHWRFIADMETCIPMAKGQPRPQQSSVIM